MFKSRVALRVANGATSGPNTVGVDAVRDFERWRDDARLPI